MYCLYALSSPNTALLTQFDCTMPQYTRAGFWSKLSQFGKNLYVSDTSIGDYFVVPMVSAIERFRYLLFIHFIYLHFLTNRKVDSKMIIQSYE